MKKISRTDEFLGNIDLFLIAFYFKCLKSADKKMYLLEKKFHVINKIRYNR